MNETPSKQLMGEVMARDLLFTSRQTNTDRVAMHTKFKNGRLIMLLGAVPVSIERYIAELPRIDSTGPMEP